MVPHAQLFKLGKGLREAAKRYGAVGDKAERAQLARREREERLDGVSAEDHRVYCVLVWVRIAREVAKATRYVARIRRGLESQMLDARFAVLGLDAKTDKEKEKTASA